VETNVLQRCLFTKYQFGLSRNQRVQNVHNAFVVNHKFHKLLSGKRVLLVDDVMTTGATINACVKALLEAKVASVDVIVLARRGLD
jgi:predicted amidophosphoribosyltransferase